MKPEPVFDVAIVGGGLSGLAAAVALGGEAVRTPLSVVLIDAGEPGAGGASFDGRASAVTLASRRMFEALKLWPQLESHAQPMREIIVTDAPLGAQSRPALLHFAEATAGNEPAAWMIENRHLLAALHEAVAAAGNITVREAEVARLLIDRDRDGGPHPASPARSRTRSSARAGA